MAIEKLKFEIKQDNPTRIAQITKANLPSNQYSRSAEYNAIAEKINEIIPEVNAGVTGYQGKIYPTDKKDAIGFYFAAESGVYPYAGNFTIDITEGINHLMFDGAKWDKMLTPIEASGKVEEDNTGIISGNEVYNSLVPINKELSSITNRDNIFNPINILHDVLLSQNGNEITLIDSKGSVTAFMPLEVGVNKYTLKPYPINTSGRRAALINSIKVGSKGYTILNNKFTSNNDLFIVFGLKYGENGEYLNPENVMIHKGHEFIDFKKYTDLDIKTISVIENSSKPVNSFAFKPMFETLLATNIFNPINLLENTLISQNGNTIELVNSKGSITAYCELEDDYYKIIGHPIDSEGRRTGQIDSLEIGTKGLNNSNEILKRIKKYLVMGVKFGTEGILLNPNSIAVLNDINQPNFIKYGDYKSKIDIDNYKTSSLMIGASFAYYNEAEKEGNIWYKSAYSKLKTFNKNLADGTGVSMTNFVKHIYQGNLYNSTTIDDFNHLIIYLSHNVDVCDGNNLKDTAQDYEPITGDNYSNSQNWDYFLKKYYDDCYKQKDNPNSKYFGSQFGKPVSIIVFTHWHDGRQIFNTSIRQLRDKWGFNLIELDKHIGFSSNTPNPISGKQVSINYAVDTEEIKIDGEKVIFGWHPLRNGTDLFVQDRTKNVFIDFISKL